MQAMCDDEQCTCQRARQRGAARCLRRRGSGAAATARPSTRPPNAPPPSYGARARTSRIAEGSADRPPTAPLATPRSSRSNTPKIVHVCLCTGSPHYLLRWFWNITIYQWLHIFHLHLLISAHPWQKKRSEIKYTMRQNTMSAFPQFTKDTNHNFLHYPIVKYSWCTTKCHFHKVFILFLIRYNNFTLVLIWVFWVMAQN